MRRVTDQYEVGRVGRDRLQVKRKIGPNVSIDYQEGRIAEQRQGARDATAGFQWPVGFARIGDIDAIGPPIAEVSFDQMSEVGNVDYNVADSRHRQCGKMSFDERVITDFDQRLGQRVG